MGPDLSLTPSDVHVTLMSWSTPAYTPQDPFTAQPLRNNYFLSHCNRSTLSFISYYGNTIHCYIFLARTLRCKYSLAKLSPSPFYSKVILIHSQPSLQIWNTLRAYQPTSHKSLLYQCSLQLLSLLLLTVPLKYLQPSELQLSNYEISMNPWKCIQIQQSYHIESCSSRTIPQTAFHLILCQHTFEVSSR